MKTIQDLLERAPFFLIISGGILLIIAAVSKIVIGSLSLTGMDNTGRIILTVGGAGLILGGVVMIWVDNRQSHSSIERSKGFVKESPRPLDENKQTSDASKPSNPPFAESLSRCGLTNAFRITKDNAARLDRVSYLIDQELKASGKLRLCASSGHNYLHPSGAVWQQRLGKLITNRLIDMTVVLELPFSSFAMTRALANEVSHHHWEEKINPKFLADLLEYTNIHIRVTEEAVNCSLFLTSQAVYYDPYLWALTYHGGRTENKFWVFEFDKVSDVDLDCYSLLEKHFEFLLRNSIPLEEFLYTPAAGSAIAYGKDYYYLYTKDPVKAFNRYEKLTKKFHQDMNDRFNRR